MDISLSSIVNIPLARELFGSPAYGYFKRLVEFSHHNGNDGGYCRGEWHQISEEEYNAFRHLNGVRIDSHVHASFWEYEKRAVNHGWPQELISMLEQVDYE